jgi:hypothetical protein
VLAVGLLDCLPSCKFSDDTQLGRRLYAGGALEPKWRSKSTSSKSSLSAEAEFQILDYPHHGRPSDMITATLAHRFPKGRPAITRHSNASRSRERSGQNCSAGPSM